jgi:guanylate kinase
VIFVIFGGGGVGKGTLAARLVAADPVLQLSRSWTTRARRPGEEADAYTFVEDTAFQRKVDEKGFLEWVALWEGQRSGTPWPPDPPLPPGADLLLEIDFRGAQLVKERAPEAVAILIVPPSREAQRQRLEGRGDPPEKIEHRLALADEEERLGYELADHVVVNDDLDRAIEEVAGIIEGHRKRQPGD